MKRMKALLLGDWRNISRDPMLLFIIAAPVLMGVVPGIIIPFAGELLADRFSVDLHPHYPFIAAVFSLIPTMLAGMMLGLVFLDERDDDILTALSVTPLSRSGYLFYKTIFTAVAGILFCFVFLAVLNLSSYPWLLLLPSAAASGLLGAVLLLMLALFAAVPLAGLVFWGIGGILFQGVIIFLLGRLYLNASMLPIRPPEKRTV